MIRISRAIAPTPLDRQLLVAGGAILLLLAKYSELFARRLTRIGPLELFLEDATPVLQRISHLSEVLDGPPGTHAHRNLSEEEKILYERGRILLEVSALVGDATSERLSAKRHHLLFRLGSYAMRNAEFERARLYLAEVWREEVLKESFRHRVAFNYAKALTECAKAALPEACDRLHEAARSLLEAGSDRAPNDADFPVLQAYCEQRLRRYGSAERLLEHALQLLPDHALGLYNRACLHVVKDRNCGAAMDTLERIQARMRGSRQLAKDARTDEDLAMIRADPILTQRFKAWIKAVET